MFLHVVMDVTDVCPKGFGPILMFLPSRGVQRLVLPPKTPKKGQMLNFGCNFLEKLFWLPPPHRTSKAVILPQLWGHILQTNAYMCRFVSFLPKYSHFEDSKLFCWSTAFHSISNFENRTNGSEVSPSCGLERCSPPWAGHSWFGQLTVDSWHINTHQLIHTGHKLKHKLLKQNMLIQWGET